MRGKVAATFVDTGEQSLKNIPSPLRVYRVEFEKNVRPLPRQSTSSSHNKPSIAVLPFQNLSGDSEQDYFCEGLVDDILTSLSKLAGLRVIARNSSFVYKGRSVDVRDAAKQLGVQYILEGAFARAPTAFESRAANRREGRHSPLGGTLRPGYRRHLRHSGRNHAYARDRNAGQLTEGEQARLRYTTTANVEAWTYWAQGLSHFRQSMSKEHARRPAVLGKSTLRLTQLCSAQWHAQFRALFGRPLWLVGRPRNGSCQGAYISIGRSN